MYLPKAAKPSRLYLASAARDLAIAIAIAPAFAVAPALFGAVRREPCAVEMLTDSKRWAQTAINR
jgi:hypothetical protein